MIKNPSYQPPKAITLKHNYNKLIPTLSNSVIPPKINLTENDIKSWIESIEQQRSSISNTEKDNNDVMNYKNWTTLQQRKVAPGFNFESIMTPSSNIIPIIAQNDSVSGGDRDSDNTNDKSNDNINDNEDTSNELDKLFGKVSIQ